MKWPILPSVFHNLRDQSSIPNVTAELLWHWLFPVIVFFFGGRQVDVDGCAFACEDLSAQAIGAQVYRTAVHLVEQDCWHDAEDLNGEFWTFDDVDRGDEGVKDDVRFLRVVDCDGIGLSVDANRGVLAFGDENGLIEFCMDFDGGL